MLKSILRFFGVEGDPSEIGESLFGIIADGVFVNATKHKVVLNAGPDGKLVLKGKFDVEGGVVTAGTISGYTAFVEGSKLVKAYGFDLDFSELQAALEDGEAAIPLLFSADRAFGSKDNDIVFAAAKLIKGGAGDDFIISEFVDKRIKGEAGDDVIISGTGNDVLFGGKGRDVFGFREPDDGVDKIRDFRVGKDKIGLDDEGFGVLGPGVDATEFVIGTDATTAEQRIVYDDLTGALYWDADGVGGAAKVRMATLDDGLKLTAASFTVDIFI